MDKIKFIFAGLIVTATVIIYYQFTDWLQIVRVGVLVIGVLLASLATFSTESGRSIMVFAKEANIERQKIVWPSRREAMQVTGLVIFLVIVFGLYLWLLDTLSFYSIYDLLLDVQN